MQIWFFLDTKGQIQPGYEDLIVNVKDNFENLGKTPGTSTITVDVNLAITNEFKCEVLLKNHQYCVDTIRIQFEGTCLVYTIKCLGWIHKIVCGFRTFYVDNCKILDLRSNVNKKFTPNHPINQIKLPYLWDGSNMALAPMVLNRDQNGQNLHAR